MSLTDDILMHYGMPRRSGRYPWGSGDNPYQHSGDFLSRVEELKKSNFTFTDKDGKTYTGEVAIAKSMGLSTTQFRTQMSLAKDERRSADVATANVLAAVLSVLIACAVSVIYLIMTDTVFTMKIGVEIVVLMYLGFLISTVGYDKVIQMLKQIQSVKEETKNE